MCNIACNSWARLTQIRRCNNRNNLSTLQGCCSDSERTGSAAALPSHRQTCARTSSSSAESRCLSDPPGPPNPTSSLGGTVGQRMTHCNGVVRWIPVSAIWGSTLLTGPYSDSVVYASSLSRQRLVFGGSPPLLWRSHGPAAPGPVRAPRSKWTPTRSGHPADLDDVASRPR